VNVRGGGGGGKRRRRVLRRDVRLKRIYRRAAFRGGVLKKRVICYRTLEIKGDDRLRELLHCRTKYREAIGCLISRKKLLY
jgi:hypothetical protein